MLRGLNHDEHQHIAAGYLVGNEALLPYRDFPYFHTPYLPFVYGLFLKRGDNLLLEGRLFSTLCTALMLGVIFYTALSWAARLALGNRLLVAAGMCVLLVTSPLFAQTVGRVSNHDASILFALVAVLLHAGGMRRAGSPVRWFFSGIMLALAIGTRVTFAPLVLPFAVAAWLSPGANERKTRITWVAIFASGLFAGSLPMLYTFLAAPESFWFGVLDFSRTNLDFRFATGNPQTMTLLTKLRYFLRPIVLENAVVFLAFAGSLFLYERQRRRMGERFPRELAFLLGILPFLWLGSFAPSPLFYIYFYAPMPFLVLATIDCLSRLEGSALNGRLFRMGVASLLLSGAIVARFRYEGLGRIFALREWTPLDVHADARALRAALPHGRILTLSPILPLEAGLDIYPAFVTGPFAWRVAPFVERSRRGRLGIVAAEDLESRLADAAPDGILVGREERWEEPLVEYARSHHYVPAPQSHRKNKLWVKDVLR